MSNSTDKTDEKKDVNLEKSTSPAGYADVRKAYLLKDHARQVNLEFVASTDKKRLLSNETTANEQNGAKPPRKKLKGQNKHRPREARTPKSEKLCLKLMFNDTCPYGDSCCFSHDVKSFAEKKPKDIGENCYLFETYGRCPFGFMCRFGSCHIDSAFKNIIKEELWSKTKEKEFSINNLSKELQFQLRKRSYDFTKSDSILKLIQNGEYKTRMLISVDSDSTHGTEIHKNSKTDEKLSYVTETPISQDCCITSMASDDDRTEKRHKNSLELNDTSSNTAEDLGVEVLSDNLLECNSTKPLNPTLEDGSVRVKLWERKKIDFRDKLYLAPLTTVGNLPFRRICKEFGADITCGEMAMCVNLLQGQQSEWALLKRHPSEDVFGVQVCGAHPDVMTRCAQLLSENINIDFIDINMGCPIDLVYQKGAGCGLMNRLKKFEEIVYGMTSISDIPLTIKLRTGIYENKNIAHNVIHKIKEWGGRVSAISLHGRSREQRYTKLADWDYIEECAKLADPIPFYGCGDILSFEDANLRRQQTHISGMMIARGALIKPWIFTEIKEQRHWDISSSERFEIIKRYVNYGLEHWGCDTEGVEKTRRFLLEWLSFLYRYIPVGLLERIPQKINERPPPYFGRDDLETLMASPGCADWIKISEMLLGPVSENFVFLPKHKANAYQ